MTVKFQGQLDAKGLVCPEPVMLLHQKIHDINVGDILYIEATDPSTTRDIPKFCSFLGHSLIQNLESDSIFKYWIQKGPVKESL